MAQAVKDAITVEIEKVNASIERLQRRLLRTANAIRKLDAKRKRLVRKRLKTPEPAKEKPAPVARPEPAQVTSPKPAAPSATADASLDVPAFLRRGVPNGADHAAAEAIKAEQEDRRKRKAKGAEARRAAARRGDLKRMPLSGRAAMEHILGGLLTPKK